jgi:hypothetical protein
MKRRMVWILLGLFALAACDQPKPKELNLLCKADSFDQGGPKDPNEVVGMSIRGNDISFTGSPHFNFPASLWKAKLCPNSKYSNEKLVHFDNLGCTQANMGEIPSAPTNIIGQYDFLTKQMAILAVGNYKCSDVNRRYPWDTRRL